MPSKEQAPDTRTATERNAAAQSIADAYTKRAGIDVRHDQGAAYYHPGFDYVGMPTFETFHTTGGYYATLFHELTHSTGHADRLARKSLTDIAAFADHAYSREELCAEFGSAMLMSRAGLEFEEVETNSVAYLQHWVQKLTDDPTALLVAAGQAAKATDFVLTGKKPERVAA